MTIAIIRHLWSAALTIGRPGVARPIDWVVLASAEMLMLTVALQRPAMFRVRSLRLVGVAVAANALLVLAPLPDVVGVYRDLVPRAMLFSIAAGVATMALTFLVMSRWTSMARPEPRRSPGLHESRIPMVIVALTVIILPVWFRAGGLPPLFSLLAGTSSGDLAAGRQAALSHLGSAPLRLIIGLLRNLLIMFAAAWFLADAVTTRPERWRRRYTAVISAILVIGLGTFFALLTTERAIIGELFAVCGIAFLIARGRELSARMVGILAVIAAVFPIAVGILSGAGNTLEVLAGLRRRIFYLPTEVMVRYFIEFPRFHEYLGGSSVPKLSYITGGETFDLSGHMYIRYYQRSGNLVGNANGSFLGVGWANFGAVGVVVWALIAAVALVVLDRMIDRIPLRSRAALRGVGVVMAILTTSSDIFRNIISFVPGYLDLIVIVWLISRTEDRRTLARRSVPAPMVDDARPFVPPQNLIPSASDREDHGTFQTHL